MSYDPEAEDLREQWGLFDKQGDGKVECGELGNILRAFNLNPTQAEVKKTVSEIDPTGEKRISFEEFLPLYHTFSKKKTGGSFEHFAEAFRIFDRESNGMVSMAEIRHLLTSLGEKMSNSEVEILTAGREDSNGMVNYEEFVRNVMNE